MDNRPIGFFDSGVGGLTCISEMLQALPDERIIYFGDTARTPYGSKAADTIRTFSLEIADFLVKEGVKMIVIACNTVSSICLKDLQDRYPDIPVLGIISPAAEKIGTDCRKEEPIGVIGTKVTVRSKAYENQIRDLNPELSVFSEACPALVPLIEEGIIENEIMDLTIRYYLDEFLAENKIRTLVLGCTHYPLVEPNIRRLYPELSIVNPSKEIVRSIAKELEDRDLKADQPAGENTFYASDLSENFVNMINRISELSKTQVTFRNFNLEQGK